MRASIVLLTAGAAFVAAQDNGTLVNGTGTNGTSNITIPWTPNGCIRDFYPGRDEVIFTIPYTYAQVMSIIGSFKNLTWSGNPDNTVTLNGTDNTVGTARTYDTAGAHVVETITKYSKPPNGPYEEVHTLDLLSIPAANVKFYGDYDGTTVYSICSGKASVFNFTINFCATNANVAAAILHMLHENDAKNVGALLGNNTFTTCDAISATPTTTGTPATGTASAANVNMASISTLTLVTAAVLAVMGL